MLGGCGAGCVTAGCGAAGAAVLLLCVSAAGGVVPAAWWVSAAGNGKGKNKIKHQYQPKLYPTL